MPLTRRRFLGDSLTGLAALAGTLMLSERVLAGAEKALSSIASAGSDADLWRRVRGSVMLAPGVTHLNTGSLGACPKCVLDVTAEAWQRLESNPALIGFGESIKFAEQARQRAAAFLGAGADEVAFTNNTTEGMNAVALAVGLSKDDEVLTTNHEHAGGTVGWQYACDRVGARRVEADLDKPFASAEEIVSRFRKKITGRTRVISVSHVLYTTGLRIPIAQISRLGREHGLFVAVDGAQAPGMLHVNVKELGCDSYASSSHKWLLAPKGSGLLYLRKERQKDVRPLLLAGGVRAYTGHTGTRNFPGMIGHGLAVDWHKLIGPARVERRVLELNSLCRERLAAFRSVELLHPAGAAMRSGIASFRVKGQTAKALSRALREKDIIVRLVPQHNALRISTHIYNNAEDIARLAAALRAKGVA